MEQKVGEFCWNELATANIKGAKDFYGKVFGWQFEEHDMGGMPYTMAKKDGKEFAGFWSIPTGQEKEIPPHWMSYILVENVDQAVEKAKSAGATVVKPVMQAGDAGKLAILIDPTGAHFALWQPLKKG